MKNEKTGIRQNVEYFLKENCLTKRELANHLGISESNVNRKLNERISISDISKIAEFIGCDVRDLISDNNVSQFILGDNNVSSISGHAVSVTGNDYEKIIEKDRIEFIRQSDASRDYLQEIQHLKAEIKRLEGILEIKNGMLAEKDRVIAAKDETIKILKDRP